MTDVTDDLIGVFQGLTASDTRLHGITTSGEIVLLYDPTSVVTADRQVLGSMGLTGTYLTEVGGELYFVTFETTYEGGSSRASGFAQVIRKIGLTGEIEEVYRDTDSDGGGFGGSVRIEFGTVFDGDYVLPLYDNSMQLGVREGQVWSIGGDGSAMQLSAFTRDGAHPRGQLAATEDAVFYVGDERSPLGAYEFWRYTPERGNEYVFVPEESGSVWDVESFAGQAWFTVGFPGGAFNDEQPLLYRVGATGDAIAVDTSGLGLYQVAPRLRLTEDRLLFTDGYRELYEVAPDGTLTDLIGDSTVSIIRDVVSFDGDIYVIGDTPAGTALVRVDAPGVTVDVTPDGVGALGASGYLSVAGGKLFFEATATIDDGFGGTELISDTLWSMDADGRFDRLTGEQSGDADGIRAVGPVVAFDFSPVPATDGGDPSGPGSDPEEPGGPVPPDEERTVGTAGSDVLVGGAEDDLLVGAGGSDLMTGNGGSDVFVLNGVLPRVQVTDWTGGVDQLALDDQLLGTGDGSVDPRTMTAALAFELLEAGTVAYLPGNARLLIDTDGDGAFDSGVDLGTNVRLAPEDVVLF